jgi:hypothetical protein
LRAGQALRGLIFERQDLTPSLSSTRRKPG